MVFDADLNNPFLARFFQQAPDFDTRNAESFGDLFNALFVFESALTGRLLNLQEEEQRFGLAHGEAAQNINHGLGSIVREVLNCASGEIKGLYMTGGDTMVNVLKELGATGIEMIDYVIPQTDMVRIIGGDYAGLICVGKGGLTGPEDIISIIVDRIYQEAQQ